VTILELGIEDRFEFVQTRWPHSWGTQTVAMPADFTAATPVMRIPALVDGDLTLTDSHAICDFLNAEFGQFRLLASQDDPRWRALATMAIANGVIEAQIMRRAETLRSDKERSNDFIAKMRDRTFRCFAALEKNHLPDFDTIFDLAQITTAVACSYDDWRYGPDWRGAAPKLAAWYDSVAERPSMKATAPAETPQR
jgi:glutathione S-transferase